MKPHICPKCGSTNIKASAILVPDDGYVGYYQCQECFFCVKSNSDLYVIPEMWESRYKAIKVAKLLWDDIYKNWNNLTLEQSGYICNAGRIH